MDSQLFEEEIGCKSNKKQLLLEFVFSRNSILSFKIKEPAKRISKREALLQ
jgi:hypothetical protein